MAVALSLAGCAETPFDVMGGNGSQQSTQPSAAPPAATPATPRAQAQPQVQGQPRPQQQAQVQGQQQPQQQAQVQGQQRPQQQAQVQGQQRPQQQAPAGPTPNVVPQVLQRAGVNKCLPRIKQVTDFVTANTQHNGQFLIAPQPQTDQKMVSVMMEVQSGNQLSFVDTGFDPGAGTNQCGGMYETITYWNNSCQEVATRAYGSAKRGPPLRQAIMSLEGGANLRIFLMPTSATGCVAIKKEMVYK